MFTNRMMSVEIVMLILREEWRQCNRFRIYSARDPKCIPPKRKSLAAAALLLLLDLVFAVDDEVVRPVVLFGVLGFARHLRDLLEDLVNALSGLRRDLEVLDVASSYLREVLTPLLRYDYLVVLVDHVSDDDEGEGRRVLEHRVFQKVVPPLV